MANDMSALVNGCAGFGIDLSDSQVHQFEQYYEFLVEKNKVMNLTGITELNEVITKHFLDSVACTKVVDFKDIHSMIDIGTGAGFPGIPLKIVFPEVQMCLLDSLNKRVLFLEETFRLLGLKEIHAIHGRAEDFARDQKYREQFDLAVSRAVSNLSTLSEYCLPYVKVGGRFISYKSGKIDEEMENAKKAIGILGGKTGNVEHFALPDSDIERSLVVIDKKKPTAKKYPRKAGVPLKTPIV